MARLRELGEWFLGRVEVVADGASCPLPCRGRWRSRGFAAAPSSTIPTCLRGDQVSGPPGATASGCLRWLARDRELAWRACRIEIRGRLVERWAFTLMVHWWFTRREAPVQLVTVRDPRGRSEDIDLITTDPTATAEEVALAYADRWAIEETHRSRKQFLNVGRRRNRRGERDVVVTQGDRPSLPSHP